MAYNVLREKGTERAFTGIYHDNHKSGIYTCNAVSYTHLRAHETVLDLVCRLLLEKKKKQNYSERHSLSLN